MSRRCYGAFVALALGATAAVAAEKAVPEPPSAPTDTVWSTGAVGIAGQRIQYRAAAGTLWVHPKGWTNTATTGGDEVRESDSPTASLFYVAYFKAGEAPDRPITFVYSGGPGSPTRSEHLGLFGPRRVVTEDVTHTAAPYRLAENHNSLLDVSDVVFIDAPGTGFSRIHGKDAGHAFFGIDADAHAFGEFISSFLTRFSRWKAPKFIFGQSYGTPRSAVLVNLLQREYSIDVNGVILLSQVLNFDLSPGAPQFNPGTDEPYVTALPSYAAVAWYYNRLPAPRPPDLPAFLHQVEAFALTDYTVALEAGSTLDPARREAVARQMAAYTGLPEDYLLRSDLRIDAGQFRKMLLAKQGRAVGEIDARFSGPIEDPTAKEAGSDPAGSAFGAAYVALFNDYVRNTLGYGGNRPYRPRSNFTPLWNWDREQQPANAMTRVYGFVNVMPDLAAALRANSDLRVMVNGGYLDLATPYFEGQYEMRHLPIPAQLQDHIEYHYYMAGHMPYLNETAQAQMHANIASFILRSSRPH